MARTIFVTGTDTGVGKTTVTCGLAAALRARGLRVGVLKPAETGCLPGADGKRVAEDGERLRFFSGTAASADDCCPYRLPEPLAPSVAAERAGVTIVLETVRSVWERTCARHDIVFVEGAGGWLVPLTRERSFADWVEERGWPVLLVVGNRLGAISHARLTAESIRHRGLPLVGYVINTLSPEADLAAATNEEELPRCLGPSLGIVPHLGPVPPTPEERDRLASLFAHCIDLDPILSA